MSFLFFTLIFSIFVTLTSQTDFSEDDIFQTLDNLPITYSSTVRLQNVKSGYFLHSHELSYGSGSGQ